MNLFSKAHLVFILFALLSFTNQTSAAPRVLVFSKTEGFHHASIAVGNTAIIKLGETNGFDVDTTTNSAWFTDDVLKKYAAVIFLAQRAIF